MHMMADKTKIRELSHDEYSAEGDVCASPSICSPDPHSTETHQKFIARFNHTQRMNWQEY